MVLRHRDPALEGLLALIVDAVNSFSGSEPEDEVTTVAVRGR
jgi:hypothetical protein